jgi:DNA replication ATP-dependent helicase Dna2
MAHAGDDWQAEKAADLLTVFGKTAVVGAPNPEVVMNAAHDYRTAVYQPIAMDGALAAARPGQFIIEAQFDPMNAVFEAQWNLAWRTSVNLAWSEVRPDIIQVGMPGQFSKGLTTHGALVDLTSDHRVPLRVIDVKLSSEPGPGYFAEVTYYSLALAAWLEHNGLDNSYVVSADAALWPGSFETSRIRQGLADGLSDPVLFQELDRDLELVPTEVFVSEITRFFIDVLPRVAAEAMKPDWKATLAWHVVPSCSGCDYLGQTFPNVTNPGEFSRAHPGHCVPMALATDHLSRLPFLPRGGTTVLGRLGVSSTANLACRQESDQCFDEHHSLRAGRAIIPARARALAGSGSLGVVGTNVTSAAIPRWSDLSLYVTADFDPTSAITLAFGLSGVFQPSQFGVGAGTPPRRIPTTVYLTKDRDVLAERGELEVFLQAIRDRIVEAMAVDPAATVQLYVWDSLTLKHLTRVIGRHLGWLLANRNIATLASLFPPEDLVSNPTTTKSPAVSVVGDAIRVMVATDQPHTYTLLGTAAVYNAGGNFNPAWLQTPPYWTTQFSDQIPGERAFDIWTRRNRPALPYTMLVDNLNRTVRARHSALATITQRLRSDLRSTLERKAPECRHLAPPNLVSGSSLLGSLLVVHSRLNAAVAWQETARIRAMAPHEREARFASIRCQRQLLGQAATSALDALGLSAAPNRLVYEISPASTEAKAEVGDFNWAISPETAVGLLDRTLYRLVMQYNLGGEPWWQSRPPWLRSFEEALQVTVRAFDRYRRLVVVDLEHLSIVIGLIQAGIVNLQRSCILDPVSRDFLSSRVEKAARAIGNPPKAAASEEAIRHALGVPARGGPRRGPSNAIENFLWDPVPLESTQVIRPTYALQAALRKQLQTRGEPDLNAHQWSAWEHALNRRLTLIWGPPGTGKSRTLGVVLDAIALDARNRGLNTRLLLTAQTYTAIDNVLAPFSQRHGSSIATFRVRSRGSMVPPWVTAGMDTDTDDPDARARLNAALSSGGPVIIGAPPQQAQKVIEAVTASESGSAFDFLVIDEAGQMDVAHALLVLAGVSPEAKVVVAGDPLQLPPIHHVDAPDTLIHDVGPIYSFFREKHGVPENTLLVNYRSNAEIVDLAR